MKTALRILYAETDSQLWDRLRRKLALHFEDWLLTCSSSKLEMEKALKENAQYNLLIANNDFFSKEDVETLCTTFPYQILLLTKERGLQASKNKGLHYLTQDIEAKFLDKVPNLLNKIISPPSHSNSEENELKQLRKQKILIGEDNPMNRKLILKMMEDWSLKPKVLSNGLLIIEELKKANYDILLIDLQMPYLNGLDTIMHIKRVLQLDIKIILMTGIIFREKYQGILPIINGVLRKPFNATDLINSIQKCILNKPGEFQKNSQLKTLAKDTNKKYNLNFLRKASHNNIDFIKEMISIFNNQIEEFLPRIPILLNTKNFDELTLQIHTIKSSSRHVGSMGLFELCEQIESTIAGEEPLKANIPKLLDRFIDESTEALKQLKEVLPKL